MRILLAAAMFCGIVACGLVLVRPWLAGLVAEHARRETIARARAALGAPVTIDRAAAGFTPVVVVLEGLKLEADGAFGLRSGSSIDSLEISGDPWSLVRWGSGPIVFHIEKPNCAFALGADAAHPAEGAGEAAPAAAAPAFPPGSRLKVRRGTVSLLAPGGTSFACDGFSLDCGPGATSLKGFMGRAGCGGGILTTPLGEIRALEGQVGFTWNEGTIAVDPIILHGEGIDLAGRGLVTGLAAAAPAAQAGATPALGGSLTLGIDAAALARWLPPDAAPAGRLDFKLQGTWSAAAPRLDGRFTSDAARLYGVEASGVSGALRYDDALTLENVVATLFGGSVRGGMTVRPRDTGGWDGSATIAAQRLDAAQLLQAAGWTGPAIEGAIGYDGRHTFDQDGTASLGGGGEVTLDGRMRSTDGEARPLTARVAVQARGRTLQITDGTLRAAATEAHFSGAFSAEDGVRLSLRGASGDLSDILPLFSGPTKPKGLAKTRAAAGAPGAAPAWSGFAPLAISRAALLAAVRAAQAGAGMSGLPAIVKRLGGRWEWAGDLRGTAKGFDFDGKVTAKGLTWNSVPLGDLEADLKYAKDRLTLRSVRLTAQNGGVLTGDGTVDFKGAGALRLQGTFENIPAAIATAFATFARLPEGALSGEVNASGTFDTPGVDVHVAAGQVRVSGVDIGDIQGNVTVVPCVVRSAGLHGLVGGAVVTVQGGFPFCPAAGSEQERLTIQGDGFDLCALAPLCGVALTGKGGLDGFLEGGIVAPRGTMKVTATDLMLGGLRLGPAQIDADIQGFQANLKGGLPERHVTLSGKVEAREGVPAELAIEASDLRLRGVDIDPTFPQDIGFNLTGRVDLRGPLAQPQTLEADGRFDRVRLEVAEAYAANEAPIGARLRAGRLHVDPAVLSGPGTRIEVSGEAGIDPKQPVEVDLNGRFDLPLLRTFVRGLLAEGTGEIGLKIRGPRDDLDFSGSLKVDAPHVRYPGLPFPIDDVVERVTFDGFSAVIDSLNFRAGGGTVIGTGEMLLGKAGASRGLASILAADVRLSGHGVSAEFPEGFRSVSDPDLHLVYDPTGLLLEGTVDFVRAVYSRDFKIESTLLSGRARSPFSFGSPPEPVAGMKLDLTLRAPEELWLRNDFGRIEGEANLHIGGTAADPSILGRVTALEGSTIDFNRVRYHVQSGTIDFSDPNVIDPLFDLNAETTVADYGISLRVEGTVESFRYELTSDPPLSEPDIVSVLLTGRPVSTLGSTSSAISPESVSAYLAGQISQTLSTHFLGRVAPDVIAIDPLESVAAQGSDPATRVTLGKQITPDLRLTYSDLLGSGEAASYQVDYRVGRHVGLVSERTPEGSIAGDLRFTLPGKDPILPWEAFDLAHAQARLGEVKFAGTIGLEEKEVRRKLRLKTGQRHDRARVSDRLDRLLAFYQRKGYLTAELDVDEAATASGAIDLTVNVNAGPRMELKIEGTGGRQPLKQAIVPLFSQSLFFEETIEDARARVESLVRDRGHRVATVAAQVENDDPALTRVLFRVTPGPKTQAQEVRIEGTRQIEEEAVRREIDTHADDWRHRGIVTGGRVAEDAAAIHTLYVSKGFPEADVPPADVILQGEDGRRADVVFHVVEGPRVSLGKPRFEGNRGIDSERLTTAFDITEGEPYTRATIEAAVARVRRTYDDAGWPDARVTWSDEKTSGDEESEVRDLVVSIEEGLRQQVSDVTIGANIITDDDTIRRALKIRPYKPLSRADLLASQSRLYRLGLFRAVEVRPGPMPEMPGPPPEPRDSNSATPPGAAPNAPPTEPAVPLPPPIVEPGFSAERPATIVPAAPPLYSSAEQPPEVPTVFPPDAGAPAPAPVAAAPAEPAAPTDEPFSRPVEVLVREAPPLRQTFGLGFDTEEKIRGLYEIAHRNIFGSGRYLGLQLRASSLEQRASVLYREQGVFGGRYDLLGSAYGLDEERPAFTGRTVGITGQLSRDVTKATRLQWRYNLKDVNLSEATSEFEGTTIRLASVSGVGIHDTRDSPFNPRIGHYFSAEMQGFGNAIGSEAQFAKGRFQAFTFKEVAPSTVWAQAVRVGAAWTFGQSRSDPASTGDALSGVPQTERFYAGGDSTLRAFGRDRAGPLDAEGDPLGGEGLFLLNEELRFPLWRKLQAVVFTDIGNVYRTLSDYTLSDLRECAGGGLRLMTPIGPFRLEYGQLLDRREGEDQGQLYFSIGQAF
ncbi:MAG TPA: translocation/assembly module TamB domain-containing protein [Candidatus Polarisedimenticolia bacterium]|nr:translocation/assembly module TamB domain-containing protein [Candidatus Polarisedimenticolia bacterium]